jgi:hypothetical protein
MSARTASLVMRRHAAAHAKTAQHAATANSFVRQSISAIKHPRSFDSGNSLP